ncbi:MAG TPA: ABC transporter ATP-binding protein [Thermoplasmata archaeon]|nr:ABC transporter ATP-binding protein [Thermoplasmata archaeon]
MSGAGTVPSGAVSPLAIADLVVDYGEKRAVDGLTLSVRPGEVYGLLGSNGAGKSSTIRCIVGLVRPTRGSVRVFGLDALDGALAVKARVGYVPESPILFDALTPREFLEYVAGIRGLDPAIATGRAARYVDALQIAADIDRPLVTLSNGTRQKVLLVAAFLHQPDLLVLDEPFNNLDPRAVRIMKELLGRYVASGQRGALFSTHAMEVAEQVCHRVGILDRGVLRGEGSLPTLRREVATRDATLEAIFLRLTAEEEGVREAVRSLGEGPG